MKIYKYFILLIATLLLLGCSEEDFNSSTNPQKDGEMVYELSVEKEDKLQKFNSTTSSLLFTNQELGLLRGNLRKSSSSLKTAYDNLFQRANNGLSYNPNPYIGKDPSQFYKRLEGQAGLARNMALAYVLSDDERFGLKAIEIMEAWAKQCDGISYDRTAGTSMFIVRSIFPMLTAFDLIKNREIMDLNSKEIMISWFQGLVPEIREGVDFWEQNDYFNKQDFQNHVVSHTLGLLAFGVVLEDKALFQLGLDSPENPRDLYELIEGSIFMEGDIPHHREDPNAAPPVDGEIYDRYRHKTGGLRGLQYSHLTLTLLTLSAQICKNNGINIFDYVAPGGENLLLSFEYYSDFYRLQDSCIKSNFYCGETNRIGIAGDSPGMFEIGLKHYSNSDPLQDLINSGVYDRGRDYMHITGYTRFFSVKPGNL